MTGKKIIAAKLIALSTVLASGGSGVYCYTAGVKPWTWMADDSKIGKAELKPEKAGDSTLDAVASAWKDSKPIPSRYGDSSTASTPAARSAETTLAHANHNEPKTPPATSSRYDRYGAQQLSTGTTAVGNSAESEIAVQSAGATTASSPVEIATAPAEASERKASTSEEPTVVRGQNPMDAAAADLAASVMSNDANTTTATGASGSAIRMTDESPTATGNNMSATAARARQAFNDQPAVTGGDRYRGAAADPRRTAASTSAGAGAIANPYALQSGQSPLSAAASATAANTTTANDAGLPIPAPRGLVDMPAASMPTPISAAAAGAPAQSLPTQPASSYDRLSEPSRLSQGGYGAPIGGNTYGASQQGGLAGSGLSPINDPQGGPDGTGKPGERALEGAQNPALLVQKIAPPEIQVGKPAKFLIKVRNAGNQAAADIVIRDEVPQGTRLVSTSPIAETTGGQLMWRFGTLSVGEERTIEMQLMPTAEGDIGSVATVTYAAQASVKTRSTMPQLAIKMTAPKQVMVGQEERVKILLNNPGSGDATGVMLFENVPENVKHAAGPALEFEIGTLKAGETRELELVLLAQKAGKVTNVLSARAEGNLQVQQQVDFEVIAPALTVAVIGPERRYLERPATYEVRVENPGTATARDIQLVTKLPKGLKFVRANNMGEYDANTHAVYWSLAELPEKEKGSVELVAMPIETGPQTLEVEGRAQQGLSDQTKQQILVEGLAAIMFEVRDVEDPIEINKETTYEIRIVNQGTKAATNVQVAVALPQGMQFLSADGETKHAAQSGGVVFAPIKQLAPKADTIYRLKVQCRAAGDQRVTVEVKTDDQAQPIRREESTRVFGDD